MPSKPLVVWLLPRLAGIVADVTVAACRICGLALGKHPFKHAADKGALTPDEATVFW